MADNQEIKKMGNETSVSFLDDLKRFLRSFPYPVPVLVLLAAWCLIFQFFGNSTFGYVDTHSLFYWMFNAYNAPFSEDGHGNLIPIVFLVLCWLKREQLIAVTKQPWWPALVITLFSVMIHLVGYAVQQPRLSIIGLLGGVFGIMGQFWGLNWLKAVFFPYVILVFCIPIGSLAESITFPLRMLVSQLSVGFSHNVLGIDVVRDGSKIFDPNMKYVYDVAPACSGIRSLISLFVLSVIYGVVTFKTAWKRWLLVVLAIPLALLGNVLRIVIVIVTAERFGQDAGEAIEQKLGFLTFAVAIVVMMGLGYFLREKEDEDPPSNDTGPLGAPTTVHSS